MRSTAIFALWWSCLTRDPIEKRKVLRKKIVELRKGPFIAMASDQFRFVADWYHMALLELFSLQDFYSKPSWMARKLNLDESLVVEALARLQRVGLVKSVEGQLKVTEDFYQSFLLRSLRSDSFVSSSNHRQSRSSH